jgi:hypothetical protein
VLAVKFDAWFAWITLIALVCTSSFTVTVTEWRTKFRREMPTSWTRPRTAKAVDSLLNYETVKYFNNEGFEARRYDESLERLRRAALKSQTTLSLLNTGQQLIIAVGLVAMLWRATGRRRRPHDAGRPGHDQRLHDPALHSAGLPGRAVPRDQAEPDRPGQDVRADGEGARGGRCAGCTADAARCRPDRALRERALCL